VILRPAARGLAAGALLALAGCHPRRPPPDLSLDPAALLAEVQAAQARVVSVQGRARVGVEAPGGAGGTEQFLVAERPARLRIEVQDFFGNVVASLAVDEGRLALYDARERTFLRGAATPANLARLLPVAITPEDLVTLLCGSAPLLQGAPVSAEPADGSVLLTLRAGDLVQRLEVGPGAALLTARQRRVTAAGEQPAGLDAEFSVHRTRAGQRMPTDLSARAPEAGVALTLHWRELEVNAPVDPSLFRLTPPSGARVVDLDASPP
jgi:outer membrane lipoprotein-sorting protein